MDKTYVITGASSDIGTAFLEELEKYSKEKVNAFCQYHTNVGKLEDMKQRFTKVAIHTMACDLSDPEQTAGWISDLNGQGCKPTHILHLAAGKFHYLRLKEFSWDKTLTELQIQVNTLGQLFRTFLPEMASRQYGKIAVMLTAYTIGVPPKYMADYLIVKYAMLGLVKAAASEYSGKGITINGLSPNMVETKFLEGIDKRLIQINGEKSAMRRNATLDEVIAGLRFLLSDDSSYMNGVNLNLSGGDRM